MSCIKIIKKKLNNYQRAGLKDNSLIDLTQDDDTTGTGCEAVEEITDEHEECKCESELM